MVVASVALVNVTRGGKNPLLVEYTSSLAEALGVVVPMPVWADKNWTFKIRIVIKNFFILLQFYFPKRDLSAL